MLMFSLILLIQIILYLLLIPLKRRGTKTPATTRTRATTKRTTRIGRQQRRRTNIRRDKSRRDHSNNKTAKRTTTNRSRIGGAKKSSCGRGRRSPRENRRRRRELSKKRPPQPVEYLNRQQESTAREPHKYRIDKRRIRNNSTESSAPKRPGNPRVPRIGTKKQRSLKSHSKSDR